VRAVRKAGQAKKVALLAGNGSAPGAADAPPGLRRGYAGDGSRSLGSGKERDGYLGERMDPLSVPVVDIGDEKKKISSANGWNLPNALTLSRILISPLIVVLLLKESRRRNRLAAMALGIAALTDFLDGYLARKQGKETRLGQFLDPLADKICISSVFVMLARRGRLAGWVPGVIIGREALITLFRVYAGARGGSVPASMWGKLKTNSQLLALLAVITGEQGKKREILRQAAVAAAVALTLYSGLDYIIKSRRYLAPAEGG